MMSIIAIMPPAVAWSQMEIQDWKHVKPHLGTSAVWKITSADEKMRCRKTYAICELCFAAASLDADKNRIPNANPSLWEVFYGEFHFSFSFSTILILIFEDSMNVCIQKDMG